MARSGRERRALGGDLLVPGLALAFSLYFFHSIGGLSWEAKANGLVIGTVLVVLLTVQVGRIVAGLVRGDATLRLGGLAGAARLQAQRLGIVGLTVLFIALLPWLGLTLALFLLVLGMLLALGVRRPGRLLAVAGGVATTAYLLFIAFLHSRFPHGPVERLLEGLLRGPG